MKRLNLHVNAGLLAWSLVAGGCTAILGIDNDYREAAGGTGGGGGGGGAQNVVSSASASSGTPCGGGAGACVDVPAGWSPVWVTTGADPMMQPGQCADASPQKLYFTNPAGAPTCSACGCALGPGAACGAPQISCYFGNNTCTGSADLMQALNTATCYDVPGLPPSVQTGSCQLTGPANVTNNACKITDSTMMPAPRWGGAVLVCDSPSDPGGCNTGELCVSATPSPDGPLCIKRDGNDKCPAGFPKAISAFTDGNDTRGCAKCDCALACNGGSYVLHSSNACQDYLPPVTVNGANCTSTVGLFDFNSASLTPTLASPAVGSCSGGKPQGEVDGVGPVQFCCK